jgi:hypothetical protein
MTKAPTFDAQARDELIATLRAGYNTMERMRLLTSKQRKERAETMALVKELERRALSVHNQRDFEVVLWSAIVLLGPGAKAKP